MAKDGHCGASEMVRVPGSARPQSALFTMRPRSQVHGRSWSLPPRTSSYRTQSMLLFGSHGAWQGSDRLSAGAHRAVQWAELAAAVHGLDAATPDLLLLALISDEDGVPCRALRAHGYDVAALPQAIGGPELESDLPDGRRAPLDDAAREAVVLGVNEARRGRFEQAGAGHLLLGVIEARSGTGARIIERSGVRLADLRDTVDALERSAPLDADDAAAFERALTALLERVGGAQQCACCGAALHVTFTFCYNCGMRVTG